MPIPKFYMNMCCLPNIRASVLECASPLALIRNRHANTLCQRSH